MTDNPLLSTFNQQASDFLKNLGIVFPDDQWVAKATKLVNSATAMDERSWIPMASFMNGESDTKLESFERQMFQIPAAHLVSLMQEMNETNQDVVKRYVHNLATICRRMKEYATDFNETVSEIKQSDAYGSVLGLIQDFNDDPTAAIQKITANQGLDQMAEGLSQNPQVASMVEQMAGNLDMSQIATVLPMLGDLAKLK